MKKTLLVTMLSLAALPLFAADVKVGIVDLNDIFDKYYKTAEAKARVGEAEAGYNKERQLKMEDYQKLVDEVNKLRDDANNPALSEDVKKQKQKAGMEKVKEVQTREREIMQFDQTRRGEINQTMLRMRNGIVEEIGKEVKSFASKNGYTLVLDKSGQSVAMAPIVVYSLDALDFSQEIIKTLNANKPAAGAKPAAPAAPAVKK